MCHWLIENRPHWRRDVTLREDHSTVRSGTSSRAIAALRNTMLAIVHDAAEPLPEIREIFAENRIKAVAAVQRRLSLNGPGRCREPPCAGRAKALHPVPYR